MAETIIPRDVRSFAVKHDVPLGKITARHLDGVMCFLDIYDWAEANGKSELKMNALGAQLEWNADIGQPASAASRSAVSRLRSGTVSAYAVKRAPLNAMARNPLVDQVRAAARAANVPSPSGTPPELFVTGATPAFTASGIPPESVLQVPFSARHAMASAATRAEAMEILNMCSGPDAEKTAQMFYGRHPGDDDYADRVEQWRVASLSDDQLDLDGTRAGSDERRRREAAAGDGLSPEEEAFIASLVSGGVQAANIGNGRKPGQWSDPERYR